MFSDFYKRCSAIAWRRGFDINFLGEVDFRYQILMYRMQSRLDKKLPKILIMAGMHGDEPAGPLIAEKLMDTLSEGIYGWASITIVPAINIWGLERYTHENEQGLNANRGFVHGRRMKKKTATEGKIIMKHREMLKLAARDMFISLHEDADMNSFYVYGQGPDHEKFLPTILDTASKHFTLATGEEYGEMDEMKNGVAYDSCESSFEDYMGHAGCPRIYTLETPGLQPLEKRVACGVDIVTALIKAIAP